MTGEVHWLPFVILLIAVSPVLAFWLYGRRANKRYLIEETTVRCRTHDNQVLHVTLVRDRISGTPVGLRSCSAFKPGDVVRCTKGCLPQFVQLKTATA